MQARLSRVVVGVDGSASSLRALWVAVEEARCRYAQLVVVNCRPWVGKVAMTSLAGASLAGASAVATQSLCPAELEEGKTDISDAFVEVFGATPLDVSIRPVISALPPARALVAAARPDDLLI